LIAPRGDRTRPTAAKVREAIFNILGPPPDGAVTVIVIDGPAPTTSDARVQVTICPATEHAQPIPVALTNVVPAGSVSVIVTVVALLGPAFATLTV